MAEVSTANINDLPDSDFAYIEDGGTKDGSGKTVPRDKRHFPIMDAAHVRDALSRAPQSPFGDKAMPKIKAAAKKFGIDVDETRSDAPGMTYTRSFELDDIEIVSTRSGGDGRTVDAYAAIFDSPAEIHDQDGHYMETIDPHAFDRAIEFGRRAKGGWNIPVMYNHGMTIFHTPSPQDSMPIGVPLEIRADSKGLFTRTRYHNTPRADEALEAIREGSITSYSFAGKFHRSEPAPGRGRSYRPDSTGRPPLVRRMASTLREYGPTPFPAYEGAEIVGVRAEQVAHVLGYLSPDERSRLVELLAMAPGSPTPELGTPAHAGPADQDPPSGHSHRSPRAELQARRAQFLIRHGGPGNAGGNQ